MKTFKVFILVVFILNLLLSCNSKPKYDGTNRLLGPIPDIKLDTIFTGAGEDWDLMLTRQEVYIYYTLNYPSLSKTFTGWANQFNGYDLQGRNYYLENDSLELRLQILEQECECNNKVHPTKVLLNHSVGCGSDYHGLFINSNE